MATVRFLLVLLGTCLLAGQAKAQDGGGWGRFRDRSGRDGQVEEILRGLDTNGNGLIEEEEATGFQRRMLERILRRNNIEPKFPLSVKQVLETVKRNDAAGGRSGGPPPGPGGFTPAAPGPSGIKPISGFGVAEVQSPAAGFGVVRKPETPPTPGKPPEAAGNFPPPGGAPNGAGPMNPGVSGASKPAPRKSGRFLTAKERLPQGLPDWFIEKDADSDGQISMAEFTSDWTPEKAREFNSYDINHDGFITAAEYLKVEKPKQAASR